MHDRAHRLSRSSGPPAIPLPRSHDRQRRLARGETGAARGDRDWRTMERETGAARGGETGGGARGGAAHCLVRYETDDASSLLMLVIEGQISGGEATPPDTTERSFQSIAVAVELELSRNNSLSEYEQMLASNVIQTLQGGRRWAEDDPPGPDARQALSLIHRALENT